ncbi:MAG: hypothetical protein ACQCN4_05140 [Candidatus Bathyarchaeia archaeon]|jgi:hypothetical protein
MTISKNKRVLLGISLILAVAVLSTAVAMDVFYDDQLATKAGTVDFTCHAGSEHAFVFSVEVDLSDGMDSGEATAVARCLYEFNMNQTNYEVKSVEPDGEGAWTVFLLWGSVSPKGELENHSHYYNVHINIDDRTVDYDRCY